MEIWSKEVTKAPASSAEQSPFSRLSEGQLGDGGGRPGPAQLSQGCAGVPQVQLPNAHSSERAKPPMPRQWHLWASWEGSRFPKVSFRSNICTETLHLPNRTDERQGLLCFDRTGSWQLCWHLGWPALWLQACPSHSEPLGEAHYTLITKNCKWPLNSELQTLLNFNTVKFPNLPK